VELYWGEMCRRGVGLCGGEGGLWEEVKGVEGGQMEEGLT
jgi:hypothetical protein